MSTVPIIVEKLFYDMQNRIFADVVRRIRKTGGITSTADYQLQKVQILGNSTEFIESEIKRITDMTDAELWELYDNAANEKYTRNRDLYEQINGNFIPYEENIILQSWVYAVVSQTKGAIKNITNSMGMTVSMGAGKKAFTPLAEYYQKYLDHACVDIVTGSFSYNTVLRRVVKEMTASGIRTVDYASGWSNRVPVAARRAVMTGVHQLSNQINEKVAKELGTNDYEIDWHSGFRPDHWWGGMVFSYEELKSVCRLGEVTGLCGANCGHSYTAFVKGVSVRTYTDEQLEVMNAREKETHSFQGKEYNAYDASQQQRKLETLMRQQRANVKNLKDGKADEDTIMAARTKYLNTLHQYQAFSKKMKLPEQMERVYMDGLGRIAPGRVIPKKSVVSKAKSDIIKTREVAQRNMAAGLRKSPLIPLSDTDKQHLLSEIKIIEADKNVFVFRDGIGSGYSDKRDKIFISSNIFPSNDNSPHPRDRMSERAALAHEYYGHRVHRNNTLSEGDWRDEFRASYIAAKRCPNLTNEDKMYLVADAIERAKEAGVPIKYNSFIRGCLYGYE